MQGVNSAKQSSLGLAWSTTEWLGFSLGCCPLAGGSPAASYFLLSRQKKVTKENATPLIPETPEINQRLAALAA
jgi:hypothetical protein